jgi:hypothetical protein
MQVLAWENISLITYFARIIDAWFRYPIDTVQPLKKMIYFIELIVNGCTLSEYVKQLYTNI